VKTESFPTYSPQRDKHLDKSCIVFTEFNSPSNLVRDKGIYHFHNRRTGVGLNKNKLKSNNSVAESTLRRELDPSTRPTKWVRLILHLRDADLFREAEQGSKSE
jgi:hypothetical protein